MRVLVVDVANVMGSRPDGWWRDRAGAARRLTEQVAAADLAVDEVVLVLEGKARPGAPATADGRTRIVLAEGSGDDAIVEQVTALAGLGHDVDVVTADRALRARVEALGATCVGPSWLLERL